MFNRVDYRERKKYQPGVRSIYTDNEWKNAKLTMVYAKVVFLSLAKLVIEEW